MTETSEAPRNEEANGSSTNNAREQHKQSEKDRTLFCIKIDSRCTEEILFELFLQVRLLFVYIKPLSFFFLVFFSLNPFD